jgi:hypothetical protein
MTNRNEFLNGELLNPAAKDGPFVWAGLRAIPVALILAAIGAWVA